MKYDYDLYTRYHGFVRSKKEKRLFAEKFALLMEKMGELVEEKRNSKGKWDDNKWKEWLGKVDILTQETFKDFKRVEEVILTKEEQKELKSIALSRKEIPFNLNEFFALHSPKPILTPEQGLKHIHLDIEKGNNFFNDEFKQSLKGAFKHTESHLKSNDIGRVIFEAYAMGQEVMKEKLRPFLHKPPGANVKDKKPMRLKYGKIYHDRIIYNVSERHLKERATKDDPVTAKSDAVKYINDILEKAGEKKRGMKCLEGWRDEYQIDRIMRNGNN